MDDRMSENVLNIRKNSQVEHQSHEKNGCETKAAGWFLVEKEIQRVLISDSIS